MRSYPIETIWLQLLLVAAAAAVSGVKQNSFCGHVVERSPGARSTGSSLVSSEPNLLMSQGLLWTSLCPPALWLWRLFRLNCRCWWLYHLQNSLCVGLPSKSKIAQQDIWEDIKNKYKIQRIAPCLHNAFSYFIKWRCIHNIEWLENMTFMEKKKCRYQ